MKVLESWLSRATNGVTTQQLIKTLLAIAGILSVFLLFKLRPAVSQQLVILDMPKIIKTQSANISSLALNESATHDLTTQVMQETNRIISSLPKNQVLIKPELVINRTHVRDMTDSLNQQLELFLGKQHVSRK